MLDTRIFPFLVWKCIVWLRLYENLWGGTQSALIFRESPTYVSVESRVSTTSDVKDLGHLLEPALAVLAQLSHPSSLADAGAVQAFPREAALVARLGRGGVSEQDEAKQNIDRQVSAESPWFGSKHEKWSLIFPSRMIHCPYFFSLFFFFWLFLQLQLELTEKQTGALGFNSKH